MDLTRAGYKSQSSAREKERHAQINTEGKKCVMTNEKSVVEKGCKGMTGGGD